MPTPAEIEQTVAMMADAGLPRSAAEPIATLMLSAVEKAREWKPIETCPKMTAVLLYAAGYYVGHFNETNNRWWTYTDGRGTTSEVMLNSVNKPTHWMTLPAAPSLQPAR